MGLLALLLACRPEPAAAPPPAVAELPAAPEVIASNPYAPPLRINEVMTANESAWILPDGSSPDWIELYNAAGVPIELEGVRLRAGNDEAPVGAGSLAPGAVLLLVADGGTGQGHLPLGLSAAGEDIELTLGGVVLDRVRTGQLPADLALGRYPDGGSWAPSARATPGASNGSRPSETLDPSEIFFDPTRVHAVDVLLSDEAMARLEADPYTQVEGAFGLDGFHRACVGVRKKGVYGSLRSLYGKPALKVDVNACGEGGALAGQETITLNNMVQDPSGVHEALIYAFLRGQGLPAPRTGWARVRLNGQELGFYLLLETPDENFLARWWDDPTGNLYEGAYGVDFYRGYEPYFERDEGTAPDDRADLTAVASVLDLPADDAALAQLDALVDMEQFLALMAVEALSLHWDGYSTANNYRVYRDPQTGRFQMIPWGMDQTFVDYYLGPYDARGRLFTWCLQNDTCAERYDEALLAMADAWEGWGFERRMDSLLARVVRAQLETDPRKEYDMATHDWWVERTRETMRTSPDRIRAAQAAR